MFRHKTPWVLVAALLLLGPTRAWADDTVAARRHFERGERHYGAERYARAFIEYEAAYEAAPLAAFLFNMGQCQRLLGHRDEAVALYRRYLEAAPDAANRGTVDDLLAELTASPPAAEGPADPAPDAIETDAPADVAQPVPGRDVDGGAAADDPVASIDTAPRQGPTIRLPTWLMLGGSVLLLATAGFFELQVSRGQSDLDDPSLDCSHELERCVELADDGERDAALRNAFLIGGGAALAGSLVLLALDLSADHPQERAARWQPVVSPTALGLRGTLTW